MGTRITVHAQDSLDSIAAAQDISLDQLLANSDVLSNENLLIGQMPSRVVATDKAIQRDP